MVEEVGCCSPVWKRKVRIATKIRLSSTLPSDFSDRNDHKGLGSSPDSSLVAGESDFVDDDDDSRSKVCG